MRGLVLRFVAFIALTFASASLYALPYLTVTPTEAPSAGLTLLPD